MDQLSNYIIKTIACNVMLKCTVQFNNQPTFGVSSNYRCLPIDAGKRQDIS